MNTYGRLALIFVCNVVALFFGYATGLLGFFPLLEPTTGMVLWLVVLSLITGAALFKVSSRLPWGASTLRRTCVAVVGTLVSVCFGLFVAFNTYGT